MAMVVLRNPLSSSSWATNLPQLYLRRESFRLQCSNTTPGAWSRCAEHEHWDEQSLHICFHFHSSYPIFCLLFFWLFFKRDFWRALLSAEMIHESPSNVIPWFSFFLFPFFPLAYARRQKLLLELCFSLLSRLDSCEALSNILSCTFSFIWWFDPGRRTRNFKRYPVPFVACFLCFMLFLLFLPLPFFLWHIAPWAKNSDIPG